MCKKLLILRKFLSCIVKNSILYYISTMKFEEDKIIKVCMNCFGTEPCLCNKHDYKEMYDWVYKFIKTLKPMG